MYVYKLYVQWAVRIETWYFFITSLAKSRIVPYDVTKHAFHDLTIALKNARKARIHGLGCDNVFNNNLKIGRAEIIGPWRWWRSNDGCVHNDFVHDIARVVLNIRCSASATERVNNMYKHPIGIRRCRMNNNRALRLVYTYVNSKMVKIVLEHEREVALDEAKNEPFFKLPNLIFDYGTQDPQTFGSLAHEALTNVGVEAFVANDHVHELHDIMEDLSVPILPVNIVDGSNNSNVEKDWADFDQEGLPDEEGSDGASDEMDLSLEDKLEIEEILER